MKGFVYTITSPSTDLIYVGSTTKTLVERFRYHNLATLYCSSAEILAYGDADITLVEEVEFNEIEELRWIERNYIERWHEKCVNSKLPIKYLHSIKYKDVLVYNNSEKMPPKTDAEIEAEFKKRNRERQKKYYDENKAKMAEKAKERWAATKAILAKHKAEVEEKGAAAVIKEYKASPKKRGKKRVVNKTEMIDDEMKKLMAEEEEEEEEEEAPKKPKKRNPKIKLMQMTMEQVLTEINDNKLMSPASKKIYNESGARLLKILSELSVNNLVPILADTEEVIKEIEASDYSLNGKKMIYQFILYTIDHTQIKIKAAAKAAYKLRFEVHKEDSVAEAKGKVADESLITYEDYLKKVRERFGENSKMDIIARLYHEFTPRDDFVLKIVASVDEAKKDSSKNYLIIGGKMSSKSRHYVILLHNFKTEQKYQIVDHDVSSDLSNDIKKYMEANGLQVGDYLFGSKTLSKYVSENNKRIGVAGGINTFRHMAVAELLGKEKLTTEERIKKAAKMMHAPATQLLYDRKKKPSELKGKELAAYQEEQADLEILNNL